MSRQQTQASTTRTPWPIAIKTVVETLQKNNSKPMTIQEIARKTGLNRRTVEKTTSILELVNGYLEKSDLVFFDKGNSVFVEMKRKQDEFGLLGLPNDIQNMIVRTQYYPQPSKEEEILVHLYLKKASNPKTALSLEETPLVKKLVEQENITKTPESKFYLTEIGFMVAGGALEIHSELGKL